MLITQDLHFAYNARTGFAFPDLEVDAGGHLLVLGQSGSGKTTLLHLLAGLLIPASGNVKIDGTNISALSETRLDKFRGTNIGLVYQRPHFIRALSVLENLIIAQYLAEKPQVKKKALHLLKNLGVVEKASQKTSELSQGEQQRITIARALINEPKVVLADEPTSSLDDVNCRKVAELLKQQCEQAGAVLVIVTHDQRLKDVFNKQIELT